jgi:hypothetical protein
MENGAAQGRLGELGDKRLEFRGDHQDALGLQRAADAGQGLREMVLKERLSFSGVGARFDGAFKEVGEDEAASLELSKHFVGGLPSRGDAKGGEEQPGLARKA